MSIEISLKSVFCTHAYLERRKKEMEILHFEVDIWNGYFEIKRDLRDWTRSWLEMFIESWIWGPVLHGGFLTDIFALSSNTTFEWLEEMWFWEENNSKVNDGCSV